MFSRVDSLYRAVIARGSGGRALRSRTGVHVTETQSQTVPVGCRYSRILSLSPGSLAHAFASRLYDPRPDETHGWFGTQTDTVHKTQELPKQESTADSDVRGMQDLVDGRWWISLVAWLLASRVDPIARLVMSQSARSRTSDASRVATGARSGRF